MKKIIFPLIIILFSINLFSQVQTSYSLDEEISKLLNSNQKHELDKAKANIAEGVKLKKQADQLETQAQDILKNIDLLKRSKRKKARKKYDELHSQALEIYIKAYTKTLLGKKQEYKVFTNNLNLIEKELSGTEKSKFQSYTQQAKTLYDQSQSLIREGYNSKDNEIKYKKYKEADIKISQAIGFQEKAYKTYFDKKYNIPQNTHIAKSQPQNTPKTNQQAKKQPTTNTKTSQAQKTNPTGNLATNQKPNNIPEKTAKQPKKQPPVNTYTTPTDTKTPQTQKTTVSPDKKTPTEGTYTPAKGQIYFRVQMAASKTQLSNTKLQKIYTGPIYIEYDSYDNKYKYLTAQKFYTYQEAKNFKINCGVPGAFVVAYKNGQRVRDICSVVPCKK